jgi:hypothetical protein
LTFIPCYYFYTCKRSKEGGSIHGKSFSNPSL